MDFSPYKKTSYQSHSTKKFLPYLYVLLAGVIGFLLYWIFTSYIISEKGSSVYSRYQQNNSAAQIQVQETNSWVALSEESLIKEGDSIKTSKGNDGIIIFEDGSKIYAGEDSKVYIKELKKTDEGQIFGEIIIESQPLLFSGNSVFDAEKELKIWINESVYVDAGQNVFLVEDDIISVVEGEDIHVVQMDKDGKIASQRKIGIGQSISSDSFALMATPEEHSYVPLVSVFKGTSSLPTPASEGLSESLTLDAPVIISPNFEGAALKVTGGKQKFEGTASLDTQKIIIAFSNGSETEELSFVTELSEDKTQKEWSYTASPEYESLLKGLNTYKIYGVDSQNKRSKARVIVLEYDATGDDNVYEEVSGEFLITSPNQGRNTTITGNTITLNGTATSETGFITIENKKIGSSYTLKEYKTGQKTWKYWISGVKAGNYDFEVIAKTEKGVVIGTRKITITVPKIEETPTPKPTVSLTPETSPAATLVPAVETTAATAVPTPTPTPAVTVSTMEIGR